VEIAFPIYDKTLKKRVIDEAFTYALRDNQLAWQQQPSGDYARVKSRREPFNVHQFLMQKLGV
jgi:polyphosphate kinase